MRGHELLVLLFSLSAATGASLHKSTPQLGAKPNLIAATRPAQPTPAAKLLDVGFATASETTLLLMILKAATLAIKRFTTAGSLQNKVACQLTWLLIVQGSSRLQGICQISKPTKTLNPDWYDKLAKPAWNPPPWAFPVAWIPLKILQTIAANLAWQALGQPTLSLPIVLFLAHIALGDVWNVQFFVKQRPLTGLLTIYAFLGVLIAATGSFLIANPISGYLVAPTVAWVVVASSLNLDVWFLNR